METNPIYLIAEYISGEMGYGYAPLLIKSVGIADPLTEICTSFTEPITYPTGETEYFSCKNKKYLNFQVRMQEYSGEENAYVYGFMVDKAQVRVNLFLYDEDKLLIEEDRCITYTSLSEDTVYYSYFRSIEITGELYNACFVNDNIVSRFGGARRQIDLSETNASYFKIGLLSVTGELTSLSYTTV